MHRYEPRISRLTAYKIIESLGLEMDGKLILPCPWVFMVFEEHVCFMLDLCNGLSNYGICDVC